MINVIATITVKKEKKADFIRIFKANVPDVLAEDGCIEYHPTVDAATDLGAQSTDDNRVVIIEKWESLDHLKAHLAAPHMVQYKKDTEGMSTGLDLRILEDAWAVEETPDAAALKALIEKSGLPFKKFFNTSGKKYRELGLKDRLPGMTLDEAAELLASDGMLIKRPLLIKGDRVLVGFREPEW